MEDRDIVFLNGVFGRLSNLPNSGGELILEGKRGVDQSYASVIFYYVPNTNMWSIFSYNGQNYGGDEEYHSQEIEYDPGTFQRRFRKEYNLCVSQIVGWFEEDIDFAQQMIVEFSRLKI